MKESNVTLVRYNTDRFTDEMKEEIKKLLKNTGNMVSVKGPAREEFVKWIQEELKDIKEINDGYYGFITEDTGDGE